MDMTEMVTMTMTKRCEEHIKNLLVDEFYEIYYKEPTVQRSETLQEIAWTLEYMGEEELYERLERCFLNTYYTAKRYPENH